MHTNLISFIFPKCRYKISIISNGQFFKFHFIPHCWSKFFTEFSLSISSKFRFYLYLYYLIDLILLIHVNLNKNVSKIVISWFKIEFKYRKYSSISKTSEALIRNSVSQAIRRWEWEASTPCQLEHGIFQPQSWINDGNNCLVTSTNQLHWCAY